MPNVFASAASNLATSLKRTAGISCTYARSDDSCDLTMWRGGKVLLEPTDYGPEEWESHDFFCEAADLTFDNRASLVTPARDDVVTFEDENGDTQIFTVAAPGERNPYRYSDRGRTLLRIHTREGA